MWGFSLVRAMLVKFDWLIIIWIVRWPISELYRDLCYELGIVSLSSALISSAIRCGIYSKFAGVIVSFSHIVASLITLNNCTFRNSLSSFCLSLCSQPIRILFLVGVTDWTGHFYITLQSSLLKSTSIHGEQLNKTLMTKLYRGGNQRSSVELRGRTSSTSSTFLVKIERGIHKKTSNT